MAEAFIDKHFKTKEEKLAELDAVSYSQFQELEKRFNTLKVNMDVLRERVAKLEAAKLEVEK